MGLESLRGSLSRFSTQPAVSRELFVTLTTAVIFFHIILCTYVWTSYPDDRPPPYEHPFILLITRTAKAEDSNGISYLVDQSLMPLECLSVYI